MWIPSTKQSSKSWSHIPNHLWSSSLTARTQEGSRPQSNRRHSSIYWTYKTQLVTVCSLMKVFSMKKKSIHSANCGNLQSQEKKSSSQAKKTLKDSYVFWATSYLKWYRKRSTIPLWSTSTTTISMKTNRKYKLVNSSSSQSLNLKTNSQENCQNMSEIEYTLWQWRPTSTTFHQVTILMCKVSYASNHSTIWM